MAYYLEIWHKLSNLIALQEAYRKQRAKIYWLKDGDINSIFPLLCYGHEKNELNSVTCDDDGTIPFYHKDICEVANNCFDDLFCDNSVNIDLTIINIPQYLSPIDNDSLLAPFSLEESSIFLDELK